MVEPPVCSRCGSLLSGGACPEHGRVTPLAPFTAPSVQLFRRLVARSSLPYWLPWPLLPGWVITGAGYAGDPGEGVRATVTASAGPDPLDRSGGELLLIAEEPGIGLGSRYAWVSGPDPGGHVGKGPPEARVVAGGHPTPLWAIESPADRAVYAGSAAGRWLWLVFFPAAAASLLIEPLELADVRMLGQEITLASYGSLTPRLDHPEP